MNRLKTLSVVIALLLSASAAHTASLAERIARQLYAEGYTTVTVSRTLLGRTRIYATKPDGNREIVIDPRNGEVLRDLWVGSDRVTVARHFELHDDPGDESNESGSGADGGGEDGGGEDGGGEDGGGEDGSGEGGGGEDGGGEDGGGGDAHDNLDDNSDGDSHDSHDDDTGDDTGEDGGIHD